MQEPKQLPGNQQKIGNGKRSEFLVKPPLDKDSSATRAFLLLNRGSSNPEKLADATSAKAKNERTIEWLQQKYDKKVVESGEESPEAALLWTKLNFMRELSDFVDVQTARFIEIKNSLNIQKDNIQKQFDAKINAPRWVDNLKTYLPWLGGAAMATGVIGAGLWNWGIGKVQGVFSQFDPQNVKEMVNFIGLVSLGSWMYLQSYLARRKKEKLASKCAARKDEIDGKERGIKDSILRLVAIEYDRLSKEYDFAKQDPDIANASARAEIVRKEAQVKYGVDLPYPIFDSTRAEEAPVPKDRLNAFLSAIGGAFAALARRKAAQEAPEAAQPGASASQ
ncbi:MAG: hypothetical protein WC263_05310 [Candidatus Micrarchaeia archaeon]|jgi:hypothetical protein